MARFTKKKPTTLLLIVIFVLILLSSGFYLIYRSMGKKIHIWFPAYLAQLVQGKYGLTDSAQKRHIIFLWVDHYEPHIDTWSTEIARNRTEAMCRRYTAMAAPHFDADGHHPRRTWFYPSDQYEGGSLTLLSHICYRGFGEVELQLHHGDDTSETLLEKLRFAIDSYPLHGALITAEEVPRHPYCFVHGNWALDASITEFQGLNPCGVVDEITLLKKTGCLADFTFPALNYTSQPRQINSIFYAIDDPEQPKSHDTGPVVRAGRAAPEEGLLMVQGVIRVDWSDWRHLFYPAIDSSSVQVSYPPSPGRVDLWVDTNIHIPGREDWIFVKVHSHSAEQPSEEACMGEPAEAMFSYLEEHYNDGASFALHYVTAREAYNIIKAAEAGLDGDPGEYRDYLVPPYANTKIRSNSHYLLKSYGEGSLALEVGGSEATEILFREFLLEAARGPVTAMKYREAPREGRLSVTVRADGPMILEVRLPGPIQSSAGIQYTEPLEPVDGGNRYHLTAEPVSGRDHPISIQFSTEKKRR